MKTVGNIFPGIWEKDGIAPFKAKFIGTNILNSSFPVRAIGVYSGSQGYKNISLLSITNAFQDTDRYNDVQIVFRVRKKLNIKSHDFDQEVSKISKGLFFEMNEEIVSNILKKISVPKDQEQKGVISIEDKSISLATSYKNHILANDFYNTGKWKDFENKSATLFHLLGFHVLFEGHNSPKKRVADFYCYSPPAIKDNRICIVVDCKNQDKYFINAADERAMKEYIEDRKAIIAQEGISSKNIRFLFIARSFSKDTRIKIVEIAQKTQSFGALITYKNLIFLTEKKMRMGYKFYLEQFSNLFKNDEILSAHINYTYGTENEFRI